jgi:hypothetical protein
MKDEWQVDIKQFSIGVSFPQLTMVISSLAFFFFFPTYQLTNNPQAGW